MKSILVIAETTDNTTDTVLHWIKHLSDINIFKINDSDKIEILDINIPYESSATFIIKLNESLCISSEEILAYWYRRGKLLYNPISYNNNSINNKYIYELINNVNVYYNSEFEEAVNYIHFLFKNSHIKSINSYFDNNSNKIINLDIAKSAGFKIPHTIISNDVNRIKYFLSAYPKVIVKPIKSPGYFVKVNNDILSYSQGTNIFTPEIFNDIIKTHSCFQPTLFQEYIEKEFEIRSFFLKNKIFSMAIFSQNNEKTKIDFRNYDYAMPNRIIPFRLPGNIEGRICSFMQKIKCDSGSLDIIYGNGEFTFLEVNTQGQFGWLSKNCNYYIEKEIAKELIKYCNDGN